jgi:hypothetical protein
VGVARKARVEFEAALYHVLDRGDRREAIFGDDADRQRFVLTLGEACERTGWRVHAFAVAGMRWFQTTWTVRFNRRHRLCCHLFQGKYKAVVVDPESRGYFATLSDYIHLNPVRACMVGLNFRLPPRKQDKPLLESQRCAENIRRLPRGTGKMSEIHRLTPRLTPSTTLGYVQQSREEMEVLFTFLAERYERRSVLISSNLVFSKWEQIFHDPMMAMAAIDRLVHHSVILEFSGESHRSPVKTKAQRVKPS